MTTNRQPSDRQLRRLRLYNLVMGAFHAGQGVVILALANDFSLPVTASFMAGPPGSEPPELRDLFDIRIAWGVALFVFLSAAAHWVIAAPGVYAWYARNLGRNRNYARWVEYSVSSSVMVVLIAMFTGIGRILNPDGYFLLYGPFSYDGKHTSQSNVDFDVFLQRRDPGRGIRDVTKLKHLATQHGIELIEDIAMPINNRTLVWQKKYK